jgi:hypothetical protein
MSTLKHYLREVRNAADEHLEARHGDDESSPTPQLHLPREEALTTIALVTIRLLEQELQSRNADDAGLQALQMHLKACRKALKSHRPAAAVGEGEHQKGLLKRRRAEDADSDGGVTATSSPATAQSNTAKSVELGQYSSTDAFGQNAEKRMKFARLMGGAKAAAIAAESAAQGGASHTHHNTHAKSSAEVRRMNENLEREFESAMTHKGKKGLGA